MQCVSWLAAPPDLAQTVVQLPQCVSSLATHWPAQHSGLPTSHSLSHPPQFAGSVNVSTQ